MPAAVELRAQPDARPARPDVQRAAPLGAVHLVGAHGHQVDAVVLHVDGHLADALGGVAVKQHAAFLGELADLPDGMQGADLVVGVHQRNEDGVVAEGVLDVVDVDPAVPIDRQIRHLRGARTFEGLAGVEHRLVLGHRGNDVLAFVRVEFRDALDGEIVRFGCAAGEDDFLGPRPDQVGDPAAPAVHGFLGHPAEGVIPAGRIAVDFAQIRHHFVDHARVHGCRGLVVHVDRRAFHTSLPATGWVSVFGR